MPNGRSVLHLDRLRVPGLFLVVHQGVRQALNSTVKNSHKTQAPDTLSGALTRNQALANEKADNVSCNASLGTPF
jgi:hypothetical protein